MARALPLPLPFGHTPRRPLSVVVTGGGRGFGAALVTELVRSGHRVAYTVRDEPTGALVRECEGRTSASGLAVRCDVSRPTDVRALFEAADAFFDGAPVDAVVCNAASSGGYGGFCGASDEALERIVATNVLGTMLVTRGAVECFVRPDRPGRPDGGTMGHLFFLAGAGSDGAQTPGFAAYGATKAALAQLALSVRVELSSDPVGVHMLSPGLMRTRLLLEGLPPGAMRDALDCIAEPPEVVAEWAASEMERVVRRGERAARVRFFTPARAVRKAAAASIRHLKTWLDVQ
jgi:NAD(P)-dependent dehydrogenase (short-subunit alcohol dehydrogenase family)